VINPEELADLLELVDQEHVQQWAKLHAAGLDVVDGLRLVRRPQVLGIKVTRERTKSLE
jgi:hypothetical protein